VREECDLSIITINYNGVEDTCKMIESIPKEDFSTEVIVVDNASNNDEASEIERNFPNAVVIRSNENLGFAGGNNLGYNHSHGKKILFINNDTEFSSYGIKPLIERMESDGNIGIVCPKLKFFDKPRHIQYAGYTQLTKLTLRNRAIGYGEQDRGQYDNAGMTPYAHGAAMLVRREAIEKVGLIPICYFLYYEELDWSLMMHRAGYTIWYEPRTTIYHKESRATGRQSPLKAYYMARNRLFFAKRNKDVTYGIATIFYILIAILIKDVAGNILHNQQSLAQASLKGMKNFFTGRHRKQEQ